MLLGLRGEIVGKIVVLLGGVVDLVDVLARGLGLRDAGEIPADVFAGDACASGFAVEIVHGGKVAQDDGGCSLKRHGRRQRAVLQIVLNVGKQPWLPLRAAPNHDGICACLREHGGGFLRAGDVAVCPDGQAALLFDGGDEFVLRLPAIHLAAGAPVDGKGVDACVFGDLGDGGDVLVRVVPAEPCFKGYGNVYGAHNGVKNLRDEFFVLQQGAACQHIAHFFNGAAHVDVYYLRTKGDVVLSGSGKLGGVAACDLHGDDAAFACVVLPMAGFERVLQIGVHGYHFASRPLCAKLAGELAKGQVGDARHGG